MNQFPDVGFSGFSFMFTVIPIIMMIVFVLVFGIIIVQIIRGGIRWGKNNNSPLLTVNVKIVAKRMAVNRHHHTNNEYMNSSGSTTYFVTFEVESGDRIELKVPNNEYGMLVEGDIGKLTFQGTRYKEFKRER